MYLSLCYFVSLSTELQVVMAPIFFERNRKIDESKNESVKVVEQNITTVLYKTIKNNFKKTLKNKPG